jgi:predicted nucleic acid-binding protein
LTPTDAVPRVVLDTNVVMDWLVFRNPALTPVAECLAAGTLRWIATETMQQEMTHVLSRGLPARWALDEAGWQAAWAAHASVLPPPTVALHVPRCSDADDQKFIDLAVGAQARWLLSRDRAVLKLARRLRAYGVEVLTPERWNQAVEAEAQRLP